MRGTASATAPARALLLAVGLGVVTALGAGCARVAPPPGGPPDTTPPEVVSTVPVDGATRVDRDTDIRLEFSEEMNRVSAERELSVAPPVELRNHSWDGRTLVARPVGELPDSTTFTVRVAKSARDYHDVAMETPFELTFSTGSVIDTGVIEGVVTMLGENLPGVTVWACRGGVRTEGDFVMPCRYAAVTGEAGDFVISGVAESERPYTLLAFVDSDGDGVYSVSGETGIIAETVAVIDGPGVSASGVRIEIPSLTEGPGPGETGEEE